MARLVIWVTVFILFGSCLGTPLWTFNNFLQKCKNWMGCPIKLDMASDSVDDMYDKCEEKMKEEIDKKFLPNEQNTNENFKKAWNESEEYYKIKWEKKNTQLKKEQIMALHAYTLHNPPLYRKFNEAVRTQKSEYKTKFPYHTMHFYLTMALRTINPKGEHCDTVYRRTNCKFSKDVLNNEIRLGAFSSSSVGEYCDKMFGEKSCFEIFTCFGANISQYSKFETEREVLIPPYEVFKVTGIEESSKHNKLPCKVIYKLQSTKTYSNVNCAFFSKESLIGFN